MQLKLFSLGKYEFTDETIDYFGHILHRIRALRDIPRHNVKAGDLAGFIESEVNLSQEGDCWVGDNAYVFGGARVCINACVCGDAWVYDIAQVSGNAQVSGTAWVLGNAWVHGNTCVSTGVHTEGKICN